jgi:predicted dehydrogenase
MSKTVNVCVVGLGHWGPNLVRALNDHPQAEVVAGVEPRDTRARLVKEKNPDLRIYSTLAECLRREDLDAVVLATPAKYHHPLALQALEAGKHLLIEKPLSDQMDTALEIVALAEARQRILMTGHVFLYNEGVQEAKRIIQQETFGRISYVRSVRSNFGPFRSDVNALWDLAAHDISIFNYLFDQQPERVACTAHQFRGHDLEDFAQGYLMYPDGQVCIFLVSWIDPAKVRQMTIIGEKQMLLFDDMLPDNPIQIYDRIMEPSHQAEYTDSFESFRESIREKKLSNVVRPKETPLNNECAEFISCILDNRTPESDGVFGLEVVRILAALTQSFQQGGIAISLERIDQGCLSEELCESLLTSVDAPVSYSLT